jgi:hypothetical protein
MKTDAESGFAGQPRHWAQDAILKQLLLVIGFLGLPQGQNHAVDKAEN